MTALEVNPVTVINRYVYDVLRGAIGWNRSTYGGKTPIIPSQQVPEFTAYNAPFLVYGWSEAASGDLGFLRTGTVAYAIYDLDDRVIIKVIDALIETFSRWDVAAEDVNTYKASNVAFGDFLFTTFSIGLVEGPSPADQEGGRRSGVVTIRYDYKTNWKWTTPDGSNYTPTRPQMT